MKTIMKIYSLVAAVVVIGVVLFAWAMFASGAATLEDVTLEPSTLNITTSADVAVSFTVTEEWPADGYMIVNFPFHYGISSTSNVTSSDIGGVDFSVSNRDLIITRDGEGEALVNGDVVDDLLIEGVVTPSVEGWAGSYSVALYTLDDVLVASGTVESHNFEEQAALPPAPYAVTIEYPNGSEVINKGSIQAIEWASAGEEIDHVRVSFSRSGGDNYDVIADDVSNDGLFLWEVTQDAADRCKIKIELMNEEDQLLMADVTDGLFSIVEPEEVDHGYGLGELGLSNYWGELIKGESFSAVYYVTEDDVRHPFPSEAIYYSWYDDFDDVIEISDDMLTLFTLGSRVTMAPGNMIKIPSVPNVYIVEDVQGNMRHIDNEAIALSLFGPDWNTMITDVDVTQYGDYTIGEVIDTTVGYTIPSVTTNPVVIE